MCACRWASRAELRLPIRKTCAVDDPRRDSGQLQIGHTADQLDPQYHRCPLSSTELVVNEPCVVIACCFCRFASVRDRAFLLSSQTYSMTPIAGTVRVLHQRDQVNGRASSFARSQLGVLRLLSGHLREVMEGMAVGTEV